MESVGLWALQKQDFLDFMGRVGHDKQQEMFKAIRLKKKKSVVSVGELMQQSVADAIEQALWDVFTACKMSDSLSEWEVRKLSNVFVRESYPKAAEIFQAGQRGTHFYIVERGSVEIRTQTGKKKVLTAGDYFGERALLEDTPRTATVVAAEPVDVLALKKHDFLEFMNSGGRRQKLASSQSHRRYSSSNSAAAVAGTGSESSQSESELSQASTE